MPPKDYGDGDDEGMDDMGFSPAVNSSVVDNLEVRDQVPSMVFDRDNVPSMVFDDANTEVAPVMKKK